MPGLSLHFVDQADGLATAWVSALGLRPRVLWGGFIGGDGDTVFPVPAAHSAETGPGVFPRPPLHLA